MMQYLLSAKRYFFINKESKMNNSLSGLILLLCLAFSSNIYSQGLLGSILQGAGRATGVKPLEDLGKNADAEHKRFKENNPVYKNVEETASEFVRNPFSLACTATFESVIAAVKTSCNKMASQANMERDNFIIQSAIGRLISVGVTTGNEISGVSVKWCQGDFNGDGITPGPNEVILNRSLIAKEIDDVALTLAHELHHLRQFRSMGAGPFKCNYAKHYIQCSGCQDERHPMEKEAYQYENLVSKLLADSANRSSRQISPRVTAFVGTRNKGTFLDSPPPVLPSLSVQNLTPTTIGGRRVLLDAPLKYAKHICTLENRVSLTKAKNCIDDMEVIISDVTDDMKDDITNYGGIEKQKHYLDKSQDDIKAACEILKFTVADNSWGERRRSWCGTRAKLAIREIHDKLTDE
jgi:hypothetical protein